MYVTIYLLQKIFTFMNHYPNEITVCFNSLDKNKAIDQSNSIHSDLLPFCINNYFVSDRTNKLSTSFSQMINDSLCDIETEYIIFLNPKVIITTDDIEYIVDRLCNGYCLVALYSLGFFGCTKELFRHIGMLDETFIGGEFEDDDLALRLKIFGRKFIWHQLTESYRISPSYSPIERGSSYTVFWNKWRQDNNNHYYIPEYHKYRGINGDQHTDISNSWIKGESEGSGLIYDMRVNNSIICHDIKSIKYKICKLIIHIDSTRNFFRIEVKSDEDIAISCNLVDMNRHHLHQRLIKSNTWTTINDSFDKFELRLYNDGSPFYVSILDTPINDTLQFTLFCSIYS